MRVPPRFALQLCFGRELVDSIVSSSLRCTQKLQQPWLASTNLTTNHFAPFSTDTSELEESLSKVTLEDSDHKDGSNKKVKEKYPKKGSDTRAKVSCFMCLYSIL